MPDAVRDPVVTEISIDKAGLTGGGTIGSGMTGGVPAPCIPVSWGELVDKKTILEIKVERLLAADAVANAKRELALLTAALHTLATVPDGLAGVEAALGDVNRRLWDIENAIRRKEAQGNFDAAFIELARLVYRTNDERARLKREINTLLRSGIVEEKQYDAY